MGCRKCSLVDGYGLEFTEFVRLALTRGEWRFGAAGAILLVNLSESVAQWENADTSSGYSAKVSQLSVATLAGQTPNVPLSAATRGRLLSPASSLRLSLPSRLGSGKTCAIFHQFVCDSRGLSLTHFGDATRATPCCL
jgi:hypothetical protein